MKLTILTLLFSTTAMAQFPQFPQLPSGPNYYNPTPVYNPGQQGVGILPQPVCSPEQVCQFGSCSVQMVCR